MCIPSWHGMTSSKPSLLEASKHISQKDPYETFKDWTTAPETIANSSPTRLTPRLLIPVSDLIFLS